MTEKILLINGISPYLYILAVCLTPQKAWGTAFMIYLIIFAGQLIFTTVVGISGRDKEMLAKITMINKLIQIPYYVVFFIFSFGTVVFGMSLMGIGLLLLPVLIALDFGVFLSTLIPEEICTIKLKADGHMTAGSFILYLIGNAVYVVDIVLSVMIFRKYRSMSTTR